jgi:starch phosphorylase
MKFALNGAMTIGTLDGANIEIRDLVGPENFFLFGLTEAEVTAVRTTGHYPAAYYRGNPTLAAVLDSIAQGDYSGGDRQLFRPIVDSLLNHDEYLTLTDFQPYLDAQDAVERAYRDREGWTRMSILNAARCGFFSSDRSIRDYCELIWKAVPVDVGS